MAPNIFIFLILILSPLPLSLSAKYGEPCAISSDCDTPDLDCVASTCVCQGEPSTSFFDVPSQTCFRLPDAPCEIPPIMKCVPTSTCISSTCTCNGLMGHSIVDDKCYLGFLFPCFQHHDMCNPHQFLKCDLEGKCSCPLGTMYSGPSEKCLILPNSPCNSSSSCGTPTQCLNGICACPATSVQSKVDPRLCIIGHGGACSQPSNEDLCDPYAFLQCSNLGVCECRDFQLSFWDTESSQCYLKADVPCNTTNSSFSNHPQKCHPNSKCLNRLNQDNSPLCTCNPGFTKNRHGLCYLPLGSPCSRANDLCDPSSFLRCDLFNNCSCSSDSTYNNLLGTCELLAESTCELPAGSRTLLEIKEYQSCVPNANCTGTGSPPPIGSPTTCKCNDDLTPNVKNLCFLQHGVECTPVSDPQNDLCDPESYLTCHSSTKKCICRGEDTGHSIWNPNANKCFLLEGTPCINISSTDIGFGNNPQCIPNAHCDSSSLKCSCNNGYLVPNQNRMCYLPVGELCSWKNDLCDPAAFLECNESSGRCSCAREFETFYDKFSKTCRLIHDRPCLPTSGAQLCDRNAQCDDLSPGNFTFRCRCLSDFTPNSEKICYLTHQDDCAGYPGECDPDAPLECHDTVKRCLCSSTSDQQQEHFDPDLLKCIIWPGEICSGGANSKQCTGNAHCSETGRCECSPGFEDSFDGLCLTSYGHICSNNGMINCNSRVHLTCQNGTCACRNGYLEYRTMIQGPATTTPEERTVCLPDHGAGCEGIVGLPELTCNPNAILVCSVPGPGTGGICTCSNQKNEVYIPHLHQCRQKVNTACSIQKPCVPNANCDGIEHGVGVCKCSSNPSNFEHSEGFCILSAAHTKYLSTIVFLMAISVSAGILFSF